MPTTVFGRKAIALLCLAAILFAVLTTSSHSLVSAILAPFWLFVELLVVVSIRPKTEESAPYPFPFFCATPTRAPPIQ